MGPLESSAIRGGKFVRFGGDGGLNRGRPRPTCDSQLRQQHSKRAPGNGRHPPGTRRLRNRIGSLSVAVGDFNGDGNPDLARRRNFSRHDKRSCWGMATAPSNACGLRHGQRSSLRRGGDLNGDGKLDLVTANSGFGGGSTVSVLLGMATARSTVTC